LCSRRNTAGNPRSQRFHTLTCVSVLIAAPVACALEYTALTSSHIVVLAKLHAAEPAMAAERTRGRQIVLSGTNTRVALGAAAAGTLNGILSLPPCPPN
jgi:hypothetical protein